jgi:uncharacterized protein
MKPRILADADAYKHETGFRRMPKAAVSAISRLGGQAAHRLGVAHEWDRDEAIAAGRKGGLISAARKRERARREQMQ